MLWVSCGDWRWGLRISGPMPYFINAEVVGDGTVLYSGPGRVFSDCIVSGITILHEDHTDFDSEVEISLGRRKCAAQEIVKQRRLEVGSELSYVRNPA